MQTKLKCLGQVFAGNQHVVAVSINGSTPKPVTMDSHEELLELLEAHCTGKEVDVKNWGRVGKSGKGMVRMGFYSIDPCTQNVSTLIFDIDGAGHKDAVKDPEALHEWILGFLISQGYQPYWEVSGGGKGFHDIAFFDNAPADKAFALGRSIAAEVPRGLLELDSVGPNGETHAKLEVFPKQPWLSDGQLGNMVWLPLWHGAPEGANVLHTESGEVLTLGENGCESGGAALHIHRNSFRQAGPTGNVEKKAELLKMFFVDGLHRLNLRSSSGLWSSQRDLDEELTGLILTSHLTGERIQIPQWYRGRGAYTSLQASSYFTNEEGKTRRLSFDIDSGGKHSVSFDLPHELAVAIKGNCIERGLFPVIFASKSGTGRHVHVFFDSWVDSRLVRAVGREIVSKVPEHLFEATDIEGVVRKGVIEIFPKEDRISEMGVGASLALPWYSEVEGIGGELLDDAGQVVSVTPELEFVRSPFPEDVVPPEQEACDTPPRAFAGDGNDLSAFIDTALMALDLELVYGSIFRGEAKENGWRPCLSISSSSGDRNTSASVYVAGDGHYPRGLYKDFVNGNALSLFSFIIESGQAADFKDACMRVAEWTGTQELCPFSPEFNPTADLGWGRFYYDTHDSNDETAESETMEVHPDVNIDLAKVPRFQDLAEMVWREILKVNTDRFVNLRGELAFRVGDRFKQMGNSPKGNRLLKAHVPKHIKYWRWSKQEKQLAVQNIPDQVVQIMCADPPLEKLPLIQHVSERPYLTSKGELESEPGLNIDEHVWLRQSVQPVNPIWDSKEALRIIEEAVIDFPIKNGLLANFIAACLIPIVRPLIREGTPLCLITSQDANAGKTKLARLIMALTGSTYVEVEFSKDKQESRKSFSSALASSPDAVLFDNVEDPVKGSWLETAITSPRIQMRTLGGSKFSNTDGGLLKIMTGNNVEVGHDMGYRVLPIILEDVGHRSSDMFVHHDITSFQEEYAPLFLNALYGLVLNWVEAGMPEAPKIYNDKFLRFEKVVGGILAFHGIQYSFAVKAKAVDVESFNDSMNRFISAVRNLGWFKVADLLFEGKVPDDIHFMGTSKISLSRHLSKLAAKPENGFEKRIAKDKTAEYRYVGAGEGESGGAGDGGMASPDDVKPCVESICDDPAGDAGDDLHREKKQEENDGPEMLEEKLPVLCSNHFFSETKTSPASPASPASIHENTALGNRWSCMGSEESQSSRFLNSFLKQFRPDQWYYVEEVCKPLGVYPDYLMDYLDAELPWGFVFERVESPFNEPDQYCMKLPSRLSEEPASVISELREFLSMHDLNLVENDEGKFTAC